MTRIWLVNWHFQSRITLWRRHKSTNVSMGLCWQMSKFIVWRLWSIYFDHYLPLKPSIGKRRKQSCTPNIILIFDSIYFCFNDRFYELSFGVPMGRLSFIINCSGSCDVRFKRIYTWGLIVRKKFIAKEVAVLRKGIILSHYIFTIFTICPKPWNLLTKSEKYCASWLSAYHHELKWDDSV